MTTNIKRFTDENEQKRFFSENFPSIVYKYRDWGYDFHKKILSEKEIYFSSIKMFNDPFDCRIIDDYELLSYEEMVQKRTSHLRALEPHLSKLDLHRIATVEALRGVPTTEEERYSIELETSEKYFGIFCSSSEKDNILMWSHYCNSHQGFVVGIDSYILIEETSRLSENESHASLSPIWYVDEPPRIKPIITDDMKEILQNYVMKFSTKSSHWKYENEWRFIKIYGANKPLTLPKEAFKELILGYNMPPEHREEITSIAKENFPDMKIYQAKPEIRQFKLAIHPID